MVKFVNFPVGKTHLCAGGADIRTTLCGKFVDGGKTSAVGDPLALAKMKVDSNSCAKCRHILHNKFTEIRLCEYRVKQLRNEFGI